MKVVTVSRSNDSASVEELENLQNVLSISKTGSLKFEFKTNVKYLKAERLDSYSIDEIGSKNIMVFSGDYDSKRVLETFAAYYVDRGTWQLEQLKTTIEFWTARLTAAPLSGGGAAD